MENWIKHFLISYVLSQITWHGFIKQHPVWQEEFRRMEKWQLKKILNFFYGE